MNVFMVTAKIKPENSADCDEAARAMFAEIEKEGPKGVRYTSCKSPDGVTFVAMLELADGAENPLPAIAAFREFQENLKKWLSGPPVAENMTVVGSYRSY